MQIINCEQGTEEWFQARLGIPTASMFSTVMAGGQGKTRTIYLYKLAGEIITGECAESFGNAHTERGNLLEPEARNLYEVQTDTEVKECGFMTLGDCGYSPDGLVSEDGLIEIKTKLPHLQIDCLMKDKAPAEHIKQMQGGLWISGREWCDFISYWPGLPLFVKRVERDEKLIKQISEAVELFNKDLKEIVNKIGGM